MGKTFKSHLQSAKLAIGSWPPCHWVGLTDHV